MPKDILFEKLDEIDKRLEKLEKWMAASEKRWQMVVGDLARYESLLGE